MMRFGVRATPTWLERLQPIGDEAVGGDVVRDLGQQGARRQQEQDEQLPYEIGSVLFFKLRTENAGGKPGL